MIAQLNGLVAEKNSDSLVLDVGGVGFLVLTSATTLAAAPAAGEPMKLYTVFIVREDAMELFGFATRDERHMFDKLRGVTGIGPRTALAMLSALSVREISLALLTGDSGALTKAPGIGTKTAQRLVLELKDKVDQSELAMPDMPSVSRVSQSGAAQEATEALLALGYQPAEAALAIAAVQDQTDQVDELIRLALRGMMK